MSYETKNIRNVCLLGHGGSGKTTLAESMLYMTGAIDRQGKTADGNTVCDYDPEEIKRQITISTSIAPVNFGGCKINVLDCPGFFDFAGDVMCALRAVEAGMIFCTAKDGIAVGARQPEGVASCGLQSGHRLLVDQPGVNHRHHVKRSLVGDAASVDHLHLQLQPLGQPRGQLPAAVDQDFRTFQRGELFQKAFQRRGVVDDVAADLYDRDPFHHFSPSNSRLSTTWADISRFAASGITSERDDSITSSVTIMLRRTGRQCMK